ncbi:helix-turn-helix domain-containing protein [Pontibacter vulgaris]|uniref:helix-turn-helix domain-containing protein n=1 Tax=Pontibacter vulgaris TaxID=2905679 RepID=UPI001FA70693|nr:helix-turn-helix domain-containing protein [Pontibacter vulgaris]
MKDTTLANMFAGIEAKLVEQVAFSKQAMELQNELLHHLYLSQSIEGKPVLNGRETAYMLDISEDHLYRLTSQKKLKFYKPEGKKNYFLKEDVIAFMLRGEQRTAEEIGRVAANYKGKGGRAW